MPAISYAAALAQLAQARGDEPAITYAGGVKTWADLDAGSTAVADGLARRGVREADIVAFAGPNHPDQLMVAFGIWKLGAVPFPVPGGRPLAEMDSLIRLAEPVLLIDLPASTSGVPSATGAELTRGPASVGPSRPDIIGQRLRIGTSGGSTGRPKLIVTETPAIVNPQRPWPPGLRANGTQLMALNLTDGAGFTMATQGLATGSQLILAETHDPNQVLRLLAEHSVTWMMLTPPVMLELWKARVADDAALDLPALSICSGGGGVAPWLKQAWIDWLGPDRVWEFYAGSDGRASTTIDGASWLNRPGSVGRADRGGEVAILDPDGHPMAAGVVGDVYLRDLSGRRNFHYLGAELNTLPGGWETLGDVGWMDEDGYLYLLDRAKDVIHTADGPVYPLQIESALERLQAVRSAVVIGLPGSDGIDGVHAIVDTAEGQLADEQLRRQLAGVAPSVRIPDSIEFVAVRLRDRAGKARRSQLRADRLAPSGD